jgi:hypothetical protein
MKTLIVFLLAAFVYITNDLFPTLGVTGWLIIGLLLLLVAVIVTVLVIAGKTFDGMSKGIGW